MTGFTFARFVCLSAGAFALGCVGSAAQHIADVPQIAQPGQIENGAALALENLAVHAPLWTLTTPDTSALIDADSPVAGDGAVYFGNRFGNAPAVALDERTGKTRWTSAAPASPLAFSERLVFAASAVRTFEKARVVALDSRTGAERWSALGEYVFVLRGLAIVTNGSHLEARDAATGTLRWSVPWIGATPREAHIYGSTLVLRALVSGATLAGLLVAYDVRDGRALWTLYGTNAILGVLAQNDLVLDTTWGPSAYYAPLAVTTASLADGTKHTFYDFAPDRERWKDRGDNNGNLVQDVAADATSLVFRIGASTVYRYALARDPSVAPGTRYELGPVSRVADNSWLVNVPGEHAALLRFDASNARLSALEGTGSVGFTGAYDGLAFVAGRDRAVVLDPEQPASAAVSRFQCGAVARAFLADSALIAVCSEPATRLIALALPRTYVPSASRAAPLAIDTQPVKSFDATMHPYAVPTAFLTTRGSAFATDGSLWFCEHAAMIGGARGHSDFIGHLTSDGTIEEFAVPTFGANVAAIVRGPDNAMWFTEASAVKLGRIARDGTIAEIALPAELDRSPIFRPNATPAPLADPAKIGISRGGPARSYEKLRGLTVGADGALWVTAPYADAIARITTAGATRVFHLPPGLTGPGELTRGSDDALWFAARNAIGRMTASGAVKSYALKTELPLTSLVWGPDGNVWFSYFDGRIGRITPKGDATVLPAPIVAAPSGPLIGGCDGALYVADRFRPAFWRVTTKGEFVQHDLPYSIGALARAPDCTLGFTESQSPRTAHVGTISF